VNLLNNPNVHHAFIANKALFQLTGTYDDVPLRSYKTHFTGHLANELDEVTQGGSVLTRDALTGISSKILSISADVDTIAPIVHGFDTRRYMFLLDISPQSHGGVQNDIRFIFTGYTDFNGAVIRGSEKYIDGGMRLYFNAAYVVRDTMTMGGRGMTSTIVEAHQFLQNPQAANDFMQSIKLFAQRPEDVFAAIEMNENPVMAAVEESGYAVKDYTNSVNGVVRRSSRDLNTTSGWLSRSLTGFVNAKLGDAGNEEKEDYHPSQLYVDARSKTRDKPISSSPFLRVLVNDHGFNRDGFITYKDLCSVVANLDRIAEINEPHIGKLASRGRYSSLTGATPDGIGAAVIAVHVPPILLRFGVGAYSFRATNRLSQREIMMLPREAYIDNASGGMTHAITPLSYDSFASNVDLRQEMTAINASICREVLDFISQNHHMTYEMVVTIDMLSETEIHISVGDNMIPVPALYPAFCDGLWSPNMSSDQNSVQSLVENIGGMLNDMGDIVDRSRGRTPVSRQHQPIAQHSRAPDAFMARQDVSVNRVGYTPARTPTPTTRKSGW
jgi:hypothetical protein